MSPLLFGRVVEALIASALLMAAVLVLRVAVRRAFGPQVGYWLWALPLLRLVLPPLPAAWREAAVLPVARASEAITVLVVEPGAEVKSASLLPVVIEALAIAWAAGAALFLLFHLVSHRSFCRRIMASARAIETVDGIRIVTSAAAPGPAAFGLRRPTVALPIDMEERYDADERSLALAHEIGHHHRGDLYANWAALAVLALHWCNPLAWIAFRAFRIDQELANDARVLAGRSPAQRHVYACAIVKAAHGHAVSAACHLHTVADLKGRLKMLAASTTSRRRLASGAASVAVLAVAGLGLTASTSGAAAIGRHVEQAVADAAPAPLATARPEVAQQPGTGRQIKKVVVVKNGKSTTYDGADVDAHLAAGDQVSIAPLAPGSSRMILKMPDDPNAIVEVQDMPVGAAKCGIGSGKPASMLIRTGKGEKRMLVVCTDRIRMIAASAAATAANASEVEHNAYASALTGLVDARAKVVANADLTAVDRTRALTAIDQSITEMKEQLARGR